MEHLVTQEDVPSGQMVFRELSLVPIPRQSALLANYPNPFNPETWIPYELSEASEVAIGIYDVNGQQVREFRLGHRAAGSYTSRSQAAYWDGTNDFGERVASGVYFYSIQVGKFAATQKMFLRK
jgi:hypothetical protein